MKKINLSPRLGYFGEFGGNFTNELLYPALSELKKVFSKLTKDRKFLATYQKYLGSFAGRPTPLYFASNLSDYIGCRIYFKREDLVNGGSHKMNNTLGQVLLTKLMGKKEIITETAAGMNGVAVASAAAVFGLKCKVFMGIKDIERQKLNADKIKLLGGEVIPVTRGEGILKDAVSEAMVYWIRNLESSHYLVGSTVGPAPFPELVAFFQNVIGKEARRQILRQEMRLPSKIIACGSGGSNAVGIFRAFINDPLEMIFVEGAESAALSKGSIGIFQGTKTYVLQDDYGMDRRTSSRAAGLNYPARGPQISYLYKIGRIKAETADNQEAVSAYREIGRLEGLLPALETCHAIAVLFRRKGTFKKEDLILVNFSGRGDKDMETVLKL